MQHEQLAAEHKLNDHEERAPILERTNEPQQKRVAAAAQQRQLRIYVLHLRRRDQLRLPLRFQRIHGVGPHVLDDLDPAERALACARERA